VSRRIKKICSMSCENASDAGVSTQEEIHRSLREILDKIIELKFLIFFTVARNRESLWFSVQC
jgi:hypothetical protein